MRHRLLTSGRLACCCACLLISGGCRMSGYYINRAESPIEGVRRIAVVPVAEAQPGVPAPGGGQAVSLEAERLEESLASELLQFPGVEQVIRPAEVRRAMAENELSLHNEAAVRALAQILHADAVLITRIVEYNPYHPPRIGITAELFLTRQEGGEAAEVLAIARSGNAGPAASSDRGNVLKIERVYDAAQREIRDQAATYGRGHDFSREAVDGKDRILWVSDWYLRFVSDRIVNDLFQLYTGRAEEAAGKPG